MKVTAEKSSAKRSARNAKLKRDTDLQGIDFGPVAGHLAHYMRRLLKSFKYHFKTSVVDLDVQAGAGRGFAGDVIDGFCILPAMPKRRSGPAQLFVPGLESAGRLGIDRSIA